MSWEYWLILIDNIIVLAVSFYLVFTSYKEGRAGLAGFFCLILSSVVTMDGITMSKDYEVLPESLLRMTGIALVMLHLAYRHIIDVYNLTKLESYLAERRRAKDRRESESKGVSHGAL